MRTQLRGGFRPRAALAGLLAGLLTGLLTLGLAGTPRTAQAFSFFESKPPHIVRDPYYGVTLYDFFQQRYFTSLTDLMVAEHFGRFSHHADEAEVLRGGLLLSYGLHLEAATIFERLIDVTTAPEVRDRAWYYLARIRYQRDQLPQAEEALARIHARLPSPLEQDRNLLLGNLLMARGDYAGAVKVLEPLAKEGEEGEEGEESLYLRFNLGVAMIKDGSVARGSEILDEVGVAPAASEETRSLRDKANVALGFAALQGADPETARFYLERVRLSGMMANKALLGFGWADDALHEPRKALVPWMELAGRDTGDAAVLEAKLAVPHALGEIGAYGQSLEQYGRAIAAFDQESSRLDESVLAIRGGKLLDGLLARNPGEEMGWLWNIDRLPDMPHMAHLATVLALHEFQEAFKNYRDLVFLARNLRGWEESLTVMGDMLDNRRLAFAQRLPQVRAADRSMGIAAHERRRDGLAAELTRIEDHADGAGLADPAQRALQARLDRVRAHLQGDGLAPELRDAAQERYRRVAGALQWQLDQQYPERVWNAKKALRQLDTELSRARALDVDLASAQRDEPAHFDKFAVRIDQLRKRVYALEPRVAQLLARQRQFAQELAVAELLDQKDRLVAYTNQARYAIAQIYDRAGNLQEPAHAPAK